MTPIRRTSDAAPDFRLYGVGDRGNTFEAGAAWTRTRKDGAGDYVSLKIDFPELPQPIYATLGVMAGQDDPDVMAIIWNRPSESRGGGDPFAGLAAVGDPADLNGMLDHDHRDDGLDAMDTGAMGGNALSGGATDDDAFGGLDREDLGPDAPKVRGRRRTSTDPSA